MTEAVDWTLNMKRKNERARFLRCYDKYHWPRPRTRFLELRGGGEVNLPCAANLCPCPFSFKTTRFEYDLCGYFEYRSSHDVPCLY